MLAGTFIVTGGDEKVRAQQPARLTLAPSYVAQTIDSPSPRLNAGFGFGPVVNVGDLDRDGRNDVAVPQYSLGDGEVFFMSGANGNLIRRVPGPDASTGGEPSEFGAYVSRVADIGGCPGGQAGQVCPTNPMPAPDGLDDLLVGATGVDFGAGLDIGRAYVVDGGTGAILKRIDMPAADRAMQAAIPVSTRYGGGNRGGYGRTVFSPSSPYPADAPQAVKLGDLDGGGRADVVVGVSGFYESGPDTNPSCTPGPCAASGRAYFYRGEEIAGSNPSATLDAPYKVLKNPMAQTDDPDDPTQSLATLELFGHAVAPVGDLGACRTDPGPAAVCRRADSVITPDGRPDLLISAFRTDHPQGFFDSGVNYLLDGPTGSVLRRYDHPQPQAGAIFGFNISNQPAIGDVGSGAQPDIYLPATRQRVTYENQGRGYVLDGNFKFPQDLISFNILDDPTPAPRGNFGTSSAGIGDVAGDARNEILVGSWGSGTGGSAITDVHVFSPLDASVLLTIKDPDQQGGSQFGSAVAPLGDVNGDGFLDFAIGAGGYDGQVGANQGRFYIFRSARAERQNVRRSVSLSLQRHLVASGRLSATPRNRQCLASVPLAIQRNGRSIRQIASAADGSYRVNLPDRPGRYRVVATPVTTEALACQRAQSATRRHSH